MKITALQISILGKMSPTPMTGEDIRQKLGGCATRPSTFSAALILMCDRGLIEMAGMSPVTYVPTPAGLLAANEQLLSQLPENMKHCTILFKKCAKGHGRLTATNWVDSDCLHCQIERLNAALKERSGRTAAPAPLPYPPVGPDELQNCHSLSNITRVVVTKNHVFGLKNDVWIVLKPSSAGPVTILGEPK